jgi:hypothetical protein
VFSREAARRIRGNAERGVLKADLRATRAGVAEPEPSRSGSRSGTPRGDGGDRGARARGARRTVPEAR